MKENSSQSDDARLAALLQQSRVCPALPPRFQQNVWQRLERAEQTAAPNSWLDALAALILRPKLAFVCAAVLVFTGVAFGAREGAQSARHDAQVRYVSSVAPHFQP
jgi:hypothetical protein